METPHAPVPGAEIPEQELTPAHPQWPKSWRHLNDPPDRIHVRGNSEVLNRPVLAMVGTRRATNRGLAVARSLAAGLAAQGWVVASGLALGIDREAHLGALDVGGATIGVTTTVVPYLVWKIRCLYCLAAAVLAVLRSDSCPPAGLSKRPVGNHPPRQSCYRGWQYQRWRYR